MAVKLVRPINYRSAANITALDFQNIMLGLKVRKNFAVAVSGGPDSMALVFLSKLYAIKNGLNPKFYIVNHNFN